jgi:glycine cleavage system aminomethyltransferase T
MTRLIVDGQPVEFVAGDSVLVAMLRNDLRPTPGGCLCLGGDCPHCIATVDGVSYTRTCQVAARPGMIVERHPTDRYPDMPPINDDEALIATRNQHCDVVVIGQGESGKAAVAEAKGAGKSVIALESANGQEAIGIYGGPLVVARTSEGMLHVHAHDVVVATGAAEIQPVAPGNDLAGIVTARAATKLGEAGIDLGKVVAIGRPPEGVTAEVLEGVLVRFEGQGKVEAVVTHSPDGSETRTECNTVSIDMGLHPRDALLRMGNGLAVRAVGEAALESDIPPCPVAGTVCFCSRVAVSDLDRVWESGFHEMELVKRATLAGTGTCQGSVCLPHLRSFLKERGEELQAPFTARPVTRQPSMSEAAAGAFNRPTPRTGLDEEHRKLGAYMDRVGGWWRPWHYGNPVEEYWAVREGVSLGDVSTLGKMLVSGPDALELLERLYPTQVRTIAQGRSRYVLLLDDRGYVIDDGLICRDGETRYTLTFTSGGSSFAELWLRDWAESWKLNVHILNQTMSLGAINVTGPLATVLLQRAGFTGSLKYMQHTTAMIAGVQCRIYRLSFTGEISYELHHPAEDSAILWQRLMKLGADLGIKPHGIQTLLQLRLEKGHIIVGQDSDFDSTPRRVNMEWAVKLDKQDFVGKVAVLRTNKIPLDKQLVGLEMEAPAPIDGTTIWNGENYAGYVTSSTYSHILGKVVMLGWVRLVNGELPTVVKVDGREARRVPTPFYDPEGDRARA